MSLLKQKLTIALIFILVFGIVVSAGYFFAWLKTKPVYASKADELMYDTENKSPKYIVILPDKKMHPRKAALAKLAEFNQKKKSKKQKKNKDELRELMNNIPSVTKLEAVGERIPLPIIEPLSENMEKTAEGLLPKISEDGKKPWMIYGKSIKAIPKFYKISIIFKNLGINPQMTEKTIEVVPSEISLSFSPYAYNRDSMIKKAREAGHETYVDLILSSKDFLHSDTGPLAMDITVSEEELIHRLRQALRGKSAIGGMVVNSGMVGEDNQERLKKVLEEVKKRGLLIVDASNEESFNAIKISGLARQKADIVLENIYNSETLFKQLLEAEYAARNNGQVLIAAEPKPVVIQAINEWIKTFSPQPTNYEEVKDKDIEKPFVLVPVSNLVVE